MLVFAEPVRVALAAGCALGNATVNDFANQLAVIGDVIALRRRRGA